MKIGFLITARLKSTRLRKKILLPLNRKPIIQRIIERCKATKGVNGVVLCTSTNPQDSVLYDFALKNNIQFYPGSEDDVLDRLLSAAEYYGYDAFLSITADNPLFSIHTSEIAIDWFKKENFDFIFTKGFPIGISTYFLKTKALKVANFIKNRTDTEIWGPFVYRPDFFNIGELNIINSPFDEKFRLTCDYIEDYKLLKKIYSNFKLYHLPSINEVFNLFVEFPEFWELNSMHTQKMPDNDILKKINNSFNSMIPEGKLFAQSINHCLQPGKKNKDIEV